MSNSNWFARQGHGFKGVERSDGHIDLQKFLPAAEGFITILAEQKAKVFIPVRDRFSNNVRQMKSVAKRFPEMMTLSALINKEIEIGESDIDADCASRGVVWFTRACQFLLEAFDRSLGDKDEPLATSFRESYEVSLAKHHDGIVKHLFNLAMSFCPTRETFYRQLQGMDDNEKFRSDAKIYFTHMRRVKNRLVQFCRYHGWNVNFRDESADIYAGARQKTITMKPRPVQALLDAELTVEDALETPPSAAAVTHKPGRTKRLWRDDLLEDSAPAKRVTLPIETAPTTVPSIAAAVTLSEADPNELIA